MFAIIACGIHSQFHNFVLFILVLLLLLRFFISFTLISYWKSLKRRGMLSRYFICCSLRLSCHSAQTKQRKIRNYDSMPASFQIEYRTYQWQDLSIAVSITLKTRIIFGCQHNLRFIHVILWCLPSILFANSEYCRFVTEKYSKNYMNTEHTHSEQRTFM